MTIKTKEMRVAQTKTSQPKRGAEMDKEKSLHPHSRIVEKIEFRFTNQNIPCVPFILDVGFL